MCLKFLDVFCYFSVGLLIFSIASPKFPSFLLLAIGSHMWQPKAGLELCASRWTMPTKVREAPILGCKAFVGSAGVWRNYDSRSINMHENIWNY